MVQLKEITPGNLEAVLALQTAPEQAGYVSSNAHSLAQAYVYRKTAYPFAVCTDGVPVGFLMLGYYETRKQYTLWKLMIDRRWQQKGIGREALRQGIAYLREHFGATEVYTGVVPENTAAAGLYRSMGFRETGLNENGMLEMKLVCQSGGKD
jgi:diamine N-acetyltransferase